MPFKGYFIKKQFLLFLALWVAGTIFGVKVERVVISVGYENVLNAESRLNCLPA